MRCCSRSYSAEKSDTEHNAERHLVKLAALVNSMGAQAVDQHISQESEVLSK